MAVGLVSKPELNRQAGEIMSHDTIAGRVGVSFYSSGGDLPEGHRVFAIKPANLLVYRGDEDEEWSSTESDEEYEEDDDGDGEAAFVPAPGGRTRVEYAKRAAAKAIALLESVPAPDSDRFRVRVTEHKDCPVCLDPLHTRPAVRLPCDHMMCRPCLEKLGRSGHTTCTECRASYLPPLHEGSTVRVDIPCNDFDINQIRALFACVYHRRPRCGIARSISRCSMPDANKACSGPLVPALGLYFGFVAPNWGFRYDDDQPAVPQKGGPPAKGPSGGPNRPRAAEDAWGALRMQLHGKLGVLHRLDEFGRGEVHKGFDIILDRFSRISQPCAISPAACGVLYLVAMRMEC